MCKSVLAIAAICAAAMAQPTPTDVFQKAPPQVEKALRERVAAFLQCHVDGKFRNALEYVAEESKDYYFEMEKRRYLSFEIVKIEYSDDFTKAKVLSTIELEWRPSARFPGSRVKPPHQMAWRVENGQWYWYVANPDQWETPFGTMKFPSKSTENGPIAAVVAEIRNRVDNPEAILSQVKASKQAVTLQAFKASSDAVEITNNLSGQVTLEVETTALPGLHVKLDKAALNTGETAKLAIDYHPSSKQTPPPADVRVRVLPVGIVVNIAVSFEAPPAPAKP